MSTLVQRLDGLDGERALAGAMQQEGCATAIRLLPMALCLVALTAAALPALAEALLWPVQSRFEKASLDAHKDIAGFIALGGSDLRVLEAARLARAYPPAKLVITGHGEAAERLARQSGLPADRVVIEAHAQSTFENAQFTAQLIGADPGKTWVLVTSEWHMPRAIGAFRKANITIEAWPIADVRLEWRDMLSRATHEWLGMLSYWLRGRSDSLFPAPHERPFERAISAAPEQANAGQTNERTP